MPAWPTAIHTTAVMAMMPPVVDSPSKSVIEWLPSAVSRLMSPFTTWGSAMRAAITIRLLSTGANAAAAKRRLEFRSAIPSDVMP